MNRFDAQTLVKAGSNDKTFEMCFEDDKANRFNLSMPNHVALALIPVLDGLNTKTKSVGAYFKIAHEWRTARDADSHNVVLEIKGQPPVVFALEGAKQLWQQVPQPLRRNREPPEKARLIIGLGLRKQTKFKEA